MLGNEENKKDAIDSGSLPAQFLARAIKANVQISDLAKAFLFEVLKDKLGEKTTDWSVKRAHVFGEAEFNNAVRCCFEMAEFFDQFSKRDFQYRLQEAKKELESMMSKDSKLIIPGWESYKNSLTPDMQSHLQHHKI